MENAANEQLSPVGSRHRRAGDHLTVVCVHLSHRRLIGMNVLDADDLWT